jgi:hypothetical protein
VLWVVASAAPVWSMFFVSDSLQGSRYLYLPACGWSIFLATLLMEWPGKTRWAGIVVTAVVAVTWSVGVRAHLRDWQEAAGLRDRVLADAVTHLQATDCSTLAFTNLPDSAGGAYVFRNGFIDALDDRGAFRAMPTLGPVDQPRCSLRWDGSAFR